MKIVNIINVNYCFSSPLLLLLLSRYQQLPRAAVLQRTE